MFSGTSTSFHPVRFISLGSFLTSRFEFFILQSLTMTMGQLALPGLHLFLTLLVIPNGSELAELIVCLPIEGIMSTNTRVRVSLC